MSTPQSVDPAHKARLAEAIEDRAAQPGWSYKRIADEAGVDVVTVNALRKGDFKSRPYRRTLRGLDRALGLADGTCERILNGEEPIRPREAKKAQKPSAEQLPKGALPQEVASVIAEIESLENLSEEQRAILINTLLAAAHGIRDQAQRLNEEQAS
ncbi:hypothetical protein NE236_41600 [Actinoallomurus purpureus]|uniref:hypothetical protein n=1 Tax=Actinoallomurus purpureus TaxID=478114 RepID=UPI002093C646|nr:hypothetical protein [Actinoallomurus purpureus]MCO6011465.1 hypothetical protein [Actinoallomurus purpureus]